MNPSFAKSLENLVKDELLVEALKNHFTEVLAEARPKNEQIMQLPDNIIGSQTRAFLTAESVIEVAFRKLQDYASDGRSSIDENTAL